MESFKRQIDATIRQKFAEMEENPVPGNNVKKIIDTVDK